MLKKYETSTDKETELLLGNRYETLIEPTHLVKNCGFLSPFDFRIFKRSTNQFFGWLEVKKKPDGFSRSELFPLNKWNFAKRCDEQDIPCYFLVERDYEARLWHINPFLHDDFIQPRDIKRREDQPEGSTKVVFLPSDRGKVVYYLT